MFPSFCRKDVQDDAASHIRISNSSTVRVSIGSSSRGSIRLKRIGEIRSLYMVVHSSVARIMLIELCLVCDKVLYFTYVIEISGRLIGR